MADKSAISYTDATWNIITGCSVESPGCKHCFAMGLAGTRLRHHPSRIGLTRDTPAGPVWTGEVRFNEEWLRQPLQWQRPRLIFPVAHGDLFHRNVPEIWIDRVFAVMALANRHTYQVLTKRTARAAEYLRQLDTPAGRQRLQAAARELGFTFEHEGVSLLTLPLSHVWIGSTVEDQPRADLRRGPLRDIAAAGWVTWVSYEPAIGPVNWTGWEFIKQLVSGGESGPKARPSHPDWHRAARDFAEMHGIGYIFKQYGEWMPISQLGNGDGPGESDHEPFRKAPRLVLQSDGQIGDAFPPGAMTMLRIGTKAAGRLLDGVLHEGSPWTTRAPAEMSTEVNVRRDTSREACRA